jgi:hypothetical protein
MCFYVRVAWPLAQNLLQRLCSEMADIAVGMKRRLLYPLRRLLSRYDDVLPPECSTEPQGNSLIGFCETRPGSVLRFRATSGLSIGEDCTGSGHGLSYSSVQTFESGNWRQSLSVLLVYEVSAQSSHSLPQMRCTTVMLSVRGCSTRAK